ncbi:LTA synthase family protein [Desulfosporosinus sp. BG]|uniref:LTA synthase family protein n=1 Tax=Desulfosporosinus sp. BG TaxID=1633135 RepID=UPI00083B00FE|nr:LTA synthase family protein [Desulfosporosinus sp. BG]ODA42449.1 Lipoteichoic acid synthase LtaS Type IVa [Desulfosporosinus sp. BG]
MSKGIEGQALLQKLLRNIIKRPWYKTQTIVFFALFLLKVLIFTKTLGLTYSIQQKSQVMGTVGTLLIIFSVAFLLPIKLRKLYILLANLIISSVFFLDMIFLRHFQDLVIFRTFAAAWHYLEIESSWWKLLKTQDIFMVADFMFLIVLKLYNYIQKNKHRTVNKLTPVTQVKSKRIFQQSLNIRWATKTFIFHLIPFMMMLALGLGASCKAFGLLEENQPNITKTFYSKVYIAQSLGALEFHALDILRSSQITLDSPQPSMIALQDWFKSTHPSSDTTNKPSFGIAKDKNIIVIQVESLQQFVIEKKVNGQEITPNLNRLLKQGLYFNNYYGETWNGGTSDAEFLSNTSLYPVSKGSAYIDYPMNHYVTIANTLSKEGYSTIAIEANKPGFWDMDLMSRAEGFQQVVDDDNFVHDLDMGMGLADGSMFAQGANYLENSQQPFYSFLVTLSSHYPFEIPAQYKTINVGSYQNTVFGHYLEAVNYTDQAIGDFLNRLQSDGLLNNSMVVIYGDHPAPFNRNDPQLSEFLGFGGKEIDEFPWLAMQKVPLFIYVPGSTLNGVQNIVSGQIDLFPTLLGLLGKDASNYPLLGHDLLHSPADGIAISRNGVLVSWNCLYNVINQKAYDLNSGQSVPWRPSIAKIYQDYLGYTDTIFKHDLQLKLKP